LKHTFLLLKPDIFRVDLSLESKDYSLLEKSIGHWYHSRLTNIVLSITDESRYKLAMPYLSNSSMLAEGHSIMNIDKFVVAAAVGRTGRGLFVLPL
jgi:hypothetical protein